MRAFLAWVLAGALVDDSAWLFPAAPRGARRPPGRMLPWREPPQSPRLLPPSMSLVRANSRINIVGMIGMTLGGAWRGALVDRPRVVAAPGLRHLRRRDGVGHPTTGGRGFQPWRGRGRRPGAPIRRQRRLPRRCRNRIRVPPPLVRLHPVADHRDRALTGFLTLFLAFLMRERPIEGWSGPVVLGAVVAAASVGERSAPSSATADGWRHRRRSPRSWLPWPHLHRGGRVLLFGDAGGPSDSWPGSTANSPSSHSTRSSSDIPDHARARVFAWVETMLQAAWVLGGGLGSPSRSTHGWASLIATLLVGAAVGRASRAMGAHGGETAAGAETHQ